MKHLFTITLLGISTLSLTAQINENPIRESWMIGKIPDYTAEYVEELNEIPELILTPISAQTPLPDIVDNSQNKYMRIIFNQINYSCSAAAGVGYNFTYEINRLRDIDVSNPYDSTNWYPTHFTYNFLNEGMSKEGSSLMDNWNTIINQGCPTVPVYGGMAIDTTHWMSGYDNYDTSMYNRLTSYSKMTVTDHLKLNILKHWISDHNEGDSIGGLANFCGYFGDPNYDIYSVESPEAGKWLVTHFGTWGGHSLTIVGYNDSVRYDFNHDDLFTNNVDINGDGVIDMRDWEFGAVKVANSSGVTYMNAGFIYVPYRLLAEREDTVGIMLNHVYVIHLDTVNPYYEPEIALKLKIKHPLRKTLNFNIGRIIDTNCTQVIEKKKNFPFSNRTGGPFPMQGYNNNDPIEIEFDYSHYFDYVFDTTSSSTKELFIEVKERDIATHYLGVIYDFSLVDYRWNEVFELPYQGDLPDSTLVNDSIVTMSIEYDLIPFDMIHTFLPIYNFSNNKICRRQCRAYDDVEVTFGKGINVDFYNGTLVIEEGASLVLDDSVTLRAMKGADSLIVYGNLQIGDHVKFLAEEGASFIIDIHNPQVSLSLNDAYFNHITFSSLVDTLDVANSTFINSSAECKRTTDNYYLILYSKFYNTFVKAYAERKITEEGQIIISNCQFHNADCDSTIVIEDYPNFGFYNDTIVYADGDGIGLYNSGASVGLYKYITGCYIRDSVNSEQDMSSGIKIYHSYVTVVNNLIVNNSYGVSCLDRSNIYLTGNQSAQSPNETQQIFNNSHNQVFIIEGSFPSNFHWNVIYNSDLYHDTLVTIHTRYVSSIPIYNVENNYWGDNFDPYQDLHPTNQYDWTPVWIPPWINPKSTGEDEALFHGAEQAIIDGDYGEAESNFKQIIENYPESQYLQASVKELLVLKRIYDHDFTGLKNYLDTVPTIQQDSAAMNLAAHVANWCNIENEDYTAAID